MNQNEKIRKLTALQFNWIGLTLKQFGRISLTGTFLSSE
ncbi:hypothetical protein BKP42_61720 [Rhodococcus erythropolis]|nr:hypothetical protein BKP42_61720 [Rhodococcus erythropolis]